MNKSVELSLPYKIVGDDNEVAYSNTFIEDLIENTPIKSTNFPDIGCNVEKYNIGVNMEKIERLRDANIHLYDIIKEQDAKYRSLASVYLRNKKLIKENEIPESYV